MYFGKVYTHSSNPDAMGSCDRCTEEAVINVRYSGAHLCKEHFCQFVERRAQKEVKRQGRLPEGSLIAVAVSGGKDSLSMLSMLHRTFDRRSMSFIVLTVDEGIEGYRKEAQEFVRRLCGDLDIPFEVLSFREAFGVEMDDIASANEKTRPCTYCGVLRRSLLNRRARELGAVKIALGHNLDDMAQSILMNIVNGDVKRLVRLGPHVRVQPGLVPRMLPLRTIPEEEIKLYAQIRDISFLDRHCPYRPRAHRKGFLDIIDGLEEETPGTRHSILSSYDQIIEALREHYPPAELNKCKKCGEPTMGEVCKVCELLEAHST